MSDVIHSDELIDESVEAAESEVATTSEESEGSEKKTSLLKSMTVFDAMLLLSLIFITLATLKLFLELNTFGSFPGSFPWRTNGF